MGFTVVDTKDGKNGRVLLKDSVANKTEKELEMDAYLGTENEHGKSYSSLAAKRLGSSREKARAAEFRKKDKSLDEIEDDELDSITNKMIFGSKKSK